MSSKKIISFVILTATILITSLVLTFALIKPRTLVTNAQAIQTYNFNIGAFNSSKIHQINNEYKLTEDVKFSPTRTTEWSDEFVCYKDLVGDGVEMSNTQLLNYVCVIPFEISNKNQNNITFNLNVLLSGGDLKEHVVYKIYDFVDKEYKTCEQINTENYASTSKRINQILANSSANFCLVACADMSGESNLGDNVYVNVVVSVD